MEKIPKDFDRWNSKKKVVNLSSRFVRFHEREIWWCTIGINVGREQDSDTRDFRIKLFLGSRKNDLLILQMRSYDVKRLVRKMTTISVHDFVHINYYVQSLLQQNGPLTGSSEAEANV